MRLGRAALATFLVAVSTACGVGPYESRGIETIEGTPDQQQLLESIVSEMGSTSIEIIVVRPPPGCPEDCPDPDKRSAAWLEVTLRAQDPPGSVQAYWEGLLLTGAFRDLSFAQGLPEVLGKTIVLQDGSGVEPGPETIIAQPAQHWLETSPREEIEALIRAGVRNVGLTVESVDFIRPAEDAVVVVARTDDPESTVARRDLVLQELAGRIAYGERPLVEGIFLKILDGDGEPVTASAYSLRTGEGLGWTDDALQAAVEATTTTPP